MFLLSIIKLQRVLLASLTLLLAGCPEREIVVSPLSTDLSTQEIGFRYFVTQSEAGEVVNLNVSPYQTVGISVIGDVNLRPEDTIEVSIPDQNIELEVFGPFNNDFAIPQSSLRLPATFQVKFTRTGDR